MLAEALAAQFTKELGVEVKVLAAYPGPVITRYEIEPAVGVKGSHCMKSIWSA